jgi:hypothetical protein
MPRLTDEQIDRLEAALQAKFDRADNAGHSPENVDLMGRVADLIDEVRGAGDDDDDDDPTPAAAVASGSRRSQTSDLGTAGALARKGGNAPRSTSKTRAGAQLVDHLDRPITSETMLNERLADALNRTRGLPTDGTQLVAAATFAYPEERRLDSDATRSSDKLEAVMGQDALIAAGGICSPVNIDYSVFTVGSTSRPLRDGLPAFNADRGGVTFIVPPTLAATAGGVGVWTNSMDIAALTDPNVKKARVRLICGNTATALVDAVVERALVGNAMSRFQPETVAGLLNTLSVNYARLAELTLLGKIAAASTPVSGAQLLGATRDVLATLDQVAAAYRWRQRIPRSIHLTLVLPDWVRDLMRADLAREQANSDPLAVTDAQIAGWFTVRNLDPIWLVDGLAANGTGLPFVSQGFAAQTPGAAAVDWPRQIVFWIFSPGTFAFLDGGRLEVGVVRDSNLNDTNDLEIFSEGFEGIAFRGLTSLQVVANVRPNGLSAGTANTASY